MNRLELDVLDAAQAWEELRGPWDEIIAAHGGRINNLTITEGLDWTQTLWEVHLGSGAIQVLVVREAKETLGILSLYRQRKTIRKLPFRGIAPLTQLYSGRTGFLLRRSDAATLGKFLEHLKVQKHAWDVLSLKLVQGSADEKLILDLAGANGFSVLAVQEEYSPYIPFQENWEHHFASLPGKFRYTIRSGEKRLREKGSLTYRECRTPQDVQDFNAAVVEIERGSWKEAAGTSLTANPIQETFHRKMLPRAAECGLFSGHLLLLDGEPIAYVMGLLHKGIFLDLKNSYRSAYRECSPSHVLMNFVLPRLYEHKTHTFDFMGLCEDFKMRWTDKTYCQISYLIFPGTLRGKAAHWLRSIGGSAQKGDTCSP